MTATTTINRPFISINRLPAAKQYAEHGWPVFPAHSVVDGACTCSSGTACKHPGKHPACEHGLSDATTDMEIISRWWGNGASPNISVATGPASGFFALDIDPRHGGDTTLAALEAEHGPLPQTVEAKTGGGGRHLLFRMPTLPSGHTIPSRPLPGAPGLDVKGDRGSLIVAPSQHASGGRYEWKNSPATTDLADALPWLLTMVVKAPPERKATDPNAQIDAGKLRYAAAALDNEAASVRNAANGTRNDTLNQAAFSLGRLVATDLLTERAVRAALTDAALDAGLDQIETERTIRSGLDAGITSGPREVPEARVRAKCVTDAGTRYDAETGEVLEDEPGQPREQQAGQEGPSAPEVNATADIMSVSDWLGRDLPEPDFLLGNVFSTTSRMMLVGATGKGKTNLALALAFGIATGKGFLHWKGHRPARVMYIDGEMSRRLLKGRLAAEVKRCGVIPETLFPVSTEDHPDMPPLNTPEGQAYLDRLIERCGGVDAIVFDNIMSLLCGDMKDEEHWSQILPYVKDLTRRSIGQIWVHHTGHDETRSYGSKTREWQLDTVLHLTGAEQEGADLAFKVEFTKARERTPDNRSDFEPATIVLEQDRWCSSVTPGAGQKGTRADMPKLSASEQNALIALNLAYEQAGQRPPADCPATTAVVLEQAWRVQFYARDVSGSDKPDARQKAFKRAVDKLLAKGLVGKWQDYVWHAALGR